MSDRTREYGTIVATEHVSDYLNKIVIKAPKIASLARPAQFVFIRVEDRGRLILRRPISICEADRKTGELTLLYSIVGKGTALLAGFEKGDTIDLMGPVGTPFPAADVKKAILVAGGMGTAPLYFLAQELSANGASVSFYQGAKTRDQLLLSEELTTCTDLNRVTEEEGKLVTDILPENVSGEETVFACGPVPMLREVQKWASAHGLKGFVSLEERLACGIGACSGCAFPMKGPEGRTLYKKVCVDGPVFPLEEVLFHE